MKKKFVGTVVLVTLALSLFVAPALAAAALSMTVNAPEPCTAGTPCHIEAVVEIENWDVDYRPPYVFTYRAFVNPNKVEMTCLGWGVIKQTPVKLVCEDDDAGHVFVTFAELGIYSIGVAVEDALGQKTRETIEVEILP
ncbi:hypothetical protein A2415_04065 [candidate division WWE3 bacterium RIFOXYC1_FULL_39_7]|uniref:Uncharacterized protein n=2 Tax=Katanobacteria TaxID=422282 RepID=A0A1F4X4E3_UNCKA|nr:MAG: hypothetical protein A2415_04065 [candidate division WWE3 bacterium RIFOXYC1_FULL_39_7]OGC76558.1 MAG: hypothetical protein A2619_02450 [candidate division WWE3 bacterium RIFOXYD1_FULL_39_9]